MIYYNRSNVEGLIGFKYNNEVYCFEKKIINGVYIFGTHFIP